MFKVGIVGGTGYTGVELLRILVNHPNADVIAITSRAEDGVRVDSLYPNLRGHCDLCFSVPDIEVLAGCDVVFFATPHNVAMNMMPELLERGIRVIDLSADFRIRDAQLWSQWYGEPHACPDILKQAVYGLPEVNREAIKSAQLVACPGCYPTSIQLALLPLVEAGLIDNTSLIANAVSGVSGAGRQAKVDNLLSEVSDSFKAYGIPGHRHLPEIEQGLNDVRVTDAAVKLTFTPHLAPMVRGMHSTVYAQLLDESVSLETVQALFESRYANEPFVDVLPAASHPQTRTVKGANVCRLAVHKPQGRNTLVILSVIDNLVKGASGQAVQNMNIMLNLPENAGLNIIALTP